MNDPFAPPEERAQGGRPGGASLPGLAAKSVKETRAIFIASDAMNSNPLSRRRFLRAAGTVMALPALESIGFRRFAAAATATVARPKRAVFLGFGWGVTQDTWFPDVKVSGP